MNDVLTHLLSNRAVRLGKNSWQWAEQIPGNPSLKNAVTSRMFRSDLVEEVNGEMKLTTAGYIVAQKLVRL